MIEIRREDGLRAAPGRRRAAIHRGWYVLLRVFNRANTPRATSYSSEQSRPLIGRVQILENSRYPRLSVPRSTCERRRSLPSRPAFRPSHCQTLPARPGPTGAPRKAREEENEAVQGVMAPGGDTKNG